MRTVLIRDDAAVVSHELLNLVPLRVRMSEDGSSDDGTGEAEASAAPSMPAEAAISTRCSKMCR